MSPVQPEEVLLDEGSGMSTLRIVVFTALIIPVCNVSADDGRNCEAVLIPTVEESRADYSRTQAYMWINSEHEYERLLKMTKEQREGEASYKFFSAEYRDAKSSKDFAERVRNRLSSEKYHLDEASSRSLYRRGISDKQAESFTECKGVGSLLLSTKDVSDERFNLRVTYFAPKGVGSTDLSLHAEGGTLEGESDSNFTLHGSETKFLIVSRTEGARSAYVRGNVPGFGDAIKVDFDHQPIPPVPPVQMLGTWCTKDGGFGVVQLNVDIRNLDGSSHNFGGWVSSAPEEWATTPLFHFTVPGSSSDKMAGARWRCGTATNKGATPNCKIGENSIGQIQVQLAILNPELTVHRPAKVEWRALAAENQSAQTEQFDFAYGGSANGKKRAEVRWRCDLSR